MHADIIQITKVRVEDDAVLDENTIEPHGIIDYTNNISEESRRESIKCFARLVGDMFDLVGEDELVYNGGLDAFKEKWAQQIKDAAEKVTAENVLDWIGARYQLEKIIKNPLQTSTLFYFDEDGCNNYAEESEEFITFVSKLNVGDHIFIGGIVDYHF